MGKGWGYNTWRAKKVKKSFLSINEENIYLIVLLRARSVYHIAYEKKKKKEEERREKGKKKGRTKKKKKKKNLELSF